jgi:hypothetical protein
MNLVVDEGVDKAVVDGLRAAGFTVTYFAEHGDSPTEPWDS